ncbi:MAG: GspH/FimT family pseudopilin [Pseudomonadota bacterium]
MKAPTPTLATGANNAPGDARGFTLIEILVVVVVIGVVGVTALQQLNFGGNQDGQRDAAQRLHVLLQLAADEAVLNAQVLGLFVTTDGYQFVKRERDEKGNWVWTEYDGGGKLTGQKFDSESPLFFDLELEAQLVALQSFKEFEDSKEPVVPQLWFLPDGEVLPQYRLIVNASQAEREFRLEPSEFEPVTLGIVSR